MLSSLYDAWRPLSLLYPKGTKYPEDRASFLKRCTTEIDNLSICPDLPALAAELRHSAYQFTFAWTHRSFDSFSDSFIAKTSRLTPEIIRSLREVSVEFLIWLSKHPSSLPALHWEAFEKIVREVLASQGLTGFHVARERGRSADIIAFTQDGVSYLVECKRYSEERRVGIDVVNSVLGAALRNGVERSMLVTSSAFSADVTKRTPEWRSLNLELYDGRAVAEWLSKYIPTKDMGLWINPAARQWLHNSLIVPT